MQQLQTTIGLVIDRKAAQYDVPAALARAVAWIESRGNMHATSPAGAMGVMQLMPATAQHFGVGDPYDVTQNIDAGVRMLRRQYERFGAWEPALAAYNWGPSRVERNPDPSDWPAQVRGYVGRVLARADEEATHAAQSAEPAPPPSEPQRDQAAAQQADSLGLFSVCPACGYSLSQCGSGETLQSPGLQALKRLTPKEEQALVKANAMRESGVDADASAMAQTHVTFPDPEKAPTIPPPPPKPKAKSKPKAKAKAKRKGRN